MNARCLCEPVAVGAKVVPGLITEGCPVHWAAGKRGWHGHEVSAKVPHLAALRLKLTYPCRTFYDLNGYEFVRTDIVERWETTAETQRRLYEAAR